VVSRLPWFSKNDINGFWALLADNLANMIIITGASIFVLGIPPQVVFGRMLPGLALALLAGLSGYYWLAGRLATKEGRLDITALPYGISTPILFVYLFMIMKPVAARAVADGLSEAEAGLMAWRVGIAAAFVGGLIEMAGAVVGPWLKRVMPRAGMLGTLAGIALLWIAAVPMSEIFENPLVGFSSLAVIMVGLVAMRRLPLGIPAGLAAIALGVLVAAVSGQCHIDTSGVGFYPPVPVLGDLAAGLGLLLDNGWILAVVVPAEIYNFIETMNNVESAEAAGDSYPVGVCQVMDGMGTTVGALFGAPFPTTVYIGHPGYKRLGAGRGYALGVGIVMSLGALSGLFALLHGVIPMAAVAPMLVFIGLIMAAQAFTATPSRHALAVAIAMLPHVSNLLVSKWSSVATVLADSPASLYLPETVEALKANGVHLLGHSALSQGSILVGLIWGGMAAFLIDGKHKEASILAAAAALLTLTGIIHAPNMGLNVGSIFYAYCLLAGFFGAMWLGGGKGVGPVGQGPGE